MKVLVTGAAGFIAFNVARALLARGDTVIGIDSVNDYYDVGLKEARLRHLHEAGREQREQRNENRHGDSSSPETSVYCLGQLMVAR